MIVARVRFRNERGLDLIRRENSVLKLLRPHISITVPRFEFISSEPVFPLVGYRKIEGVSLSRCYEDMDQDRKLSMVRRLGRFLSELHFLEVYRVYTERSHFLPEVYSESMHQIVH